MTKKAQSTRRRYVERRQDWPSRFFAFIEERRGEPFSWGRQDCCLFACDGILAQTGSDPAAKLFRGQYRDALGATRLVRKHGGIGAIARKVCKELGFEAIPVGLAQRGDLVMIDKVELDMPRGMEVALGFCLGDRAAFTGTSGLVFHPMAECIKAWRISHHRCDPRRAG